MEPDSKQAHNGNPASTPKAESSSHGESGGGFLDGLKASVLKPVHDWVHRRSWTTRAAILLVVMAVPVILQNPARSKAVAATVPNVVTAFRHREAIALPTRTQDALDEAIMALSKYLRGELATADSTDPDHNAWGLSQMVVATAGHDASLLQSGVVALSGKRSSNCTCWMEYTNTGLPHTATLNWVAVALARAGLELPDDDLEFMLRGQHRGGWWAPVPATDDQRNASTYATAWSLIALSEHADSPFLTAPERARVEAAIQRGRAWLLSSKSSPGRWKDYPNAGTLGKESIALSGLVVHVLSNLREDVTDIQHEWLGQLPSRASAATDADSNPYPVMTTAGYAQKDDLRHLQLPWVIIATADAYGSGTLLERARAWHYIRSLTTSLPQLEQPVMSGMPWVAAELLIALRYLRQEMHNGNPVI